MINYPSINPVAYSLGPINIHWYGLMYLLGFAMAWWLATWRAKQAPSIWTSEKISDVIFYAAIGVIIGGRLGYILFYEPSLIWFDPLGVFKIWQGGMSFHGGILGVAVSVFLYARKIKSSFWVVADFLTPLVPLGLAAGRIGNFINGELWGRVTDVPWAMIFPAAGPMPRHPSQLYECGLEGFALFALIWWYARKPRPSGTVTALFLMGYAICRFIVEFFREPDIQLGFVAFDWLTMGQLLSLVMFIVGLIVFIYAWKKNENLFEIN